MSDLTAFERQLSGEVTSLMGPVRPVDDAAVFTAIAATRSPKWRFQSMFSAAKFVVAGAIVALFSGFLLSGVLTQPSQESAPAVGASASAEVEPTEMPTSVPAATSGGPGAFSPDGSLADARSDHKATLLPDGRVAVVGGRGPGRSVEVWDPETASFTSAGMLMEERDMRYDGSAAVLPDGQVLVVGGWHENVFRDTAEVWDPGTETSALAGSLPPSTLGSTTILPDGRVLLVGGQDEAGALASARTWDPKTATTTPAGRLLKGRRGHTATLLPDGRVLVVGGWAPGKDGKYASAEIWDPVTLSFSPAGFLYRARGDRWGGGLHTATALPDGRVLVVGGRGGGSRIPPLASAEVWDPATLTFSPAGTLAEERAMHTASLLPDGRVLVVGGASDGETTAGLDVVEIWDPSTESFTPGAPLQQGRVGHTATVLTDGRVLVAGGADASYGTGLASAEVWEPNGGAHGPADVDADTTAPDLLPGVDLVTEEVEPGVYRVLDDGTENELGFETGDPEITQVIAGQDGSVWVLDEDRLFRLGRPGWVSTSSLDSHWHDISVASDGTVWALGRRGAFGGSRSVSSLTDGDWTTHTLPEGLWARGIGTPPDGSVWASLAAGVVDCRVARLVDGGWQQEPIGLSSSSGGGASLAVGPDGTMLLGSACAGRGRLIERGEDGWAQPAVFDDSRAADFEVIGPIAMGRDGTAWVNMLGRGGTRLARRADGKWEILGDDGSMPTLDGPQVWKLSMAVSDDGRLWVAFDDPPVALAVNRDYSNDSGNNHLATLGSGCPGAISFDGTIWSQHLAGACVTHVSAAPNGNVWVTVVESPAFAEHSLDPARAATGLYVITPEAVAAAE